MLVHQDGDSTVEWARTEPFREERNRAITVEKLELENEDLQGRLAALEALTQEYRYQRLSQNIEREFKS